MLDMLQQVSGVDLKQLTVELATAFPRQAMQGISRSRNRVTVAPKFVAELVADAYNVSVAAVIGSSRAGSKARQIAMSLLARSDLLGMSLQDIGFAFSRRDHTTVLYGIEKVVTEEMYKESGYQDVLNVLCEILGVNYEAIKDVCPPRRTRNVGEATR